MITKLYTKDSNLGEREFLLREMGLLLAPVDPSSFALFTDVMSVEPVFIATTSRQMWLPFFQRIPPQSVVLLLLGNETFGKTIYDSIRDLSSVTVAFVYGFPDSGRISLCLGGFFGEIIDSSHLGLEFLLQSARNLKTGISKQR